MAASDSEYATVVPRAAALIAVARAPTRKRERLSRGREITGRVTSSATAGASTGIGVEAGCGWGCGLGCGLGWADAVAHARVRECARGLPVAEKRPLVPAAGVRRRRSVEGELQDPVAGVVAYVGGRQELWLRGVVFLPPVPTTQLRMPLPGSRAPVGPAWPKRS